ncbi:hypothetical protein MTR67_046104 [Solanum verrucosum]|uniref:Uncharacterized protein n=1 Tax=Solanum verrucosum TaxID=315347 RepID=A0AAF0UVW8_SOLVR|nr:hypothetical protein MTR67_046104 [Solanum verrucosum]
MACSLSLKQPFSSLPTNTTTQGKLPINFPVTFGCMNGKGTLIEQKFQLNCSRDKEMDLTASALSDIAAAECMDEMGTMELPPRVEAREAKEPSVSTMLMNFSNDFDPYGALSTPLYQTSTFKQVSFEETLWNAIS